MKTLPLFLVLFGLWITPKANAQDVAFDNISSDDVRHIMGDFSGNFMHTAVSGASSLGQIFGFEIGIVGGQTSSPEINKVAERTDPSVSVDKIYHAAILGQLSLPMGFTVEGSFLPKIGSDDFKFSSLGLAGKFTVTDLLADLPLSLALRAHVTKTTADLKQTVNNVTSSMELESTQMGLALVVSKNLALVEPYFTLGFAKADGTFTAPSAVFGGDLNSSTSASAKPETTYYGIGVELKLLVVKLGAEYTHLYNTDRVSGKLAFYF